MRPGVDVRFLRWYISRWIFARKPSTSPEGLPADGLRKLLSRGFCGIFDDLARSCHSDLEPPVDRSRAARSLASAGHGGRPAGRRGGDERPFSQRRVALGNEMARRKAQQRPRQKAGSHTDAWGCTWQLGDHGAVGGLIESPLAGGAAVAAYEPPAELLDPARFAKVNPVCEGTGRFTLASSEVRPLDRLRQLRGPETAVGELCDGNQDLCRLLGQAARVLSERGRALGKDPSRWRGSRR